MRCLNCNTIVTDTDPCCLSCGARCTTPVKDQQLGVPIPFIGVALMFVGIFGYVFIYVQTYGHVHGRGAVLEQKTNAYVWGLGGFFLGLIGDAIRWSRSVRRWPRVQDRNDAGQTQSLGSAFARPGAGTSRQSSQPLVLPEDPPPRGYGGFVRAIFGVVWAVVFFFIAMGVAGMVATQGAGDDPEVQKKLVEQSAKTYGTWLLLGSIALAVVLGRLGLLPGTRRRTQSPGAASAVPGADTPQLIPHPPCKLEYPPKERSGFVRAIFGVVWMVVFFFVAAAVTGTLAGQGAGDNAEVRKRLVEQSAKTYGMWLLLGSIGFAVVLGNLGLLPGTRRTKH